MSRENGGHDQLADAASRYASVGTSPMTIPCTSSVGTNTGTASVKIEANGKGSRNLFPEQVPELLNIKDKGSNMLPITVKNGEAGVINGKGDNQEGSNVIVDEQQYLDLIRKILNEGAIRDDRTGTGDKNKNFI